MFSLETRTSLDFAHSWVTTLGVSHLPLSLSFVARDVIYEPVDLIPCLCVLFRVAAYTVEGVLSIPRALRIRFVIKKTHTGIVYLHE